MNFWNIFNDASVHNISLLALNSITPSGCRCDKLFCFSGWVHGSMPLFGGSLLIFERRPIEILVRKGLKRKKVREKGVKRVENREKSIEKDFRQLRSEKCGGATVKIHLAVVK